MGREMTTPGAGGEGGRWRFWIDRGGTFTDIVGRAPDGSLHTAKTLSAMPDGRDAAAAGMADLLGVARDEPLPLDRIAEVRMGTTVATNALLERKGEPTALLITRGMADALRIGYQNRPRLFDLAIRLPEPLAADVLEVDERVGPDGSVLTPLDERACAEGLERLARAGLRSAAVVLMHSYLRPDHERRVGELARAAGFTQVSMSHEVSPLMRIVGRGDTTVVDAYLSPVLRTYVDQVSRRLGSARLFFMQSNGGLAAPQGFRGKDAILSGPAGGVIGGIAAARAAGLKQVIGFDMGGTSTDVWHWSGEVERTQDAEVAGVRVRAPMMLIHTVAAGGGSILRFDGLRCRVGPDSAGADPGPACYGRGGPLTVTDANLITGRLLPERFPQVFGEEGRSPLDVEAARTRFASLAEEIGRATGAGVTPEEAAEGFLRVAVENMANAIKKISVQRGHDVSRHALVCFGGAAGQHACRVADALGMRTVLIHPLAGMLSAYGMGAARPAVVRQRTVGVLLGPRNAARIEAALDELAEACGADLAAQGLEPGAETAQRRVMVRYEGSDTAMAVPHGTISSMAARFLVAHRTRFGFVMLGKPMVAETAEVEMEARGEGAEAGVADRPITPIEAGCGPGEGAGGRVVTHRGALRPGRALAGPAVIAETGATTVVEPGWSARIRPDGALILRRAGGPDAASRRRDHSKPDPVLLEVYGSLFMSIAEQMGAALANTAHSVNIKERLDFSCALFDGGGGLVANAPHIPVHLGSMGDSVRAIIAARGASVRPGDAFALNDPYRGGTHLPDITVVTPVFLPGEAAPLFWAASRGHHADVGGISPGSMPSCSRTVHEEGVLLTDFHLVSEGAMREGELRALLSAGPTPCRNVDQNVADLQAQLAANELGARELHRLLREQGRETVTAYMAHVQTAAEASVRRALARLEGGSATVRADNGARVSVWVTVDRDAGEAVIDFAGSSAQRDDNFNAPTAVCRAAVLYVLRCLAGEEIPLNEGCLKPVRLLIPEGSLLSPAYPAAVAAGNVETSQMVVDALLAAFGAQAGSQGTMNNLTFGSGGVQYYETLCGGSGAGPAFDGVGPVHTHMTNSRLTDPEVLEQRCPVLLEAFAARRGSGGCGRRRGGEGLERRIRFLREADVSLLANRHIVPPAGLAGGGDGAPGRATIRRASGEREALPSRASATLHPGDVLEILTPGGAGYGRPDPAGDAPVRSE